MQDLLHAVQINPVLLIAVEPVIAREKGEGGALLGHAELDADEQSIHAGVAGFAFDGQHPAVGWLFGAVFFVKGLVAFEDMGGNFRPDAPDEMVFDVVDGHKDAPSNEKSFAVDYAPVCAEFAGRLARASGKCEIGARFVERDVERQVFVRFAAVLTDISHDCVSAVGPNS
jgi:hypothetical protein